MQWLNTLLDEITTRYPDGPLLIESGASPSGTYHLGHLREMLTPDAIMLGLRSRGREAKHIHYVDDLDGLRKVAPNVPKDYEKYLGKSLCDIPAPDGSDQSYADYFVQGLKDACKTLGMDVEFRHSHTDYRAGFFTEAIEKSLDHIDDIREVLETISGHKLGEEWSPIQVNEAGYLKKRRFVSIDTKAKTLTYEDKEAKQQTVDYTKGDVKLDWRIDWPARWWLLKVNVEPAGRDHSSSGGSFDTGLAILDRVFQAPPIMPVPYDFVNLAGDTKKMSASKGTGLSAIEVVKILPPEIVRFFMLRFAPSKLLHFDPVNGVSQLIDEFAELLASRDKDNQQLIDICTNGLKPVVSTVPFTQLVASYQASLKNPAKTLELLRRLVKPDVIDKEQEVIKNELVFIDHWLANWAPEDVKFELAVQVDAGKFSDKQKDFLSQLADKVEQAPKDADGEWYHKVIYDLKDSTGLEPKDLFQTLYQVLIAKNSGPRAGWFLSILPKPWLLQRLRLKA